MRATSPPGVVRTHAAHGRQPGINPLQNLVEMRRVAPVLDLPDRRRVAGAQAGIAADASTGPGSTQASLGAGGMFLEGLGAAGRLQLVKPGIRALVVG